MSALAPSEAWTWICCVCMRRACKGPIYNENTGTFHLPDLDLSHTSFIPWHAGGYPACGHNVQEQVQIGMVFFACRCSQHSLQLSDERLQTYTPFKEQETGGNYGDQGNTGSQEDSGSGGDAGNQRNKNWLSAYQDWLGAYVVLIEQGTGGNQPNYGIWGTTGHHGHPGHQTPPRHMGNPGHQAPPEHPGHPGHQNHPANSGYRGHQADRRYRGDNPDPRFQGY